MSFCFIFPSLSLTQGVAACSLVAWLAAVWRVERSILHWGNVSSQISLISSGCPLPNSALTVQKSGLKHHSSVCPLLDPLWLTPLLELSPSDFALNICYFQCFIEVETKRINKRSIQWQLHLLLKIVLCHIVQCFVMVCMPEPGAWTCGLWFEHVWTEVECMYFIIQPLVMEQARPHVVSVFK